MTHTVVQALVVAALGLALAVAVVALARAEERATFTDRDGRFAGSLVTRGRQTDFFDARGRYQGTTTQQGTSSNPLGNVDHSRPFGSRR